MAETNREQEQDPKEERGIVAAESHMRGGRGPVPGIGVLVLLTLAHAAIGVASWPLFVPPGHFAFFHAQAGLALVAVLRFGPRAPLAVLLGTFAFRAFLAAPEGGALALGPSALLAAAAVVEALLAASCLRWLLGDDDPLAGPTQVSGLVVSAVVASAVGAGIATCALVLGGQAGIADGTHLFGVGFAGDLLGMCTLAPLGLGLLRQPRGARLRWASVTGAPVALAVTGCMVVYAWQRESARSDYETELGQRSAHLAQVIESQVAEMRFAVSGLGALYAASREVDRDEFAIFARRTLESHPEIAALEWVPRVRANERADFEARARAQGRPDPAIRERRGADLVSAGARDEHFPVDFVEPQTAAEGHFGLDLAASPGRRSILESARDTGRLAVTERTPLAVRPGAQGYGTLLVLPIYRNGTALDTLDQRRSAHTGYVVAVVDMNGLMRHAFADEDANSRGFRMAMHDLSAASERRELWSDGSPVGDGLIWMHALEVGGRQWALESQETGALAAVRPNWGWLVVALAATALLEMLLLAMGQGTERLERLVEQRSSELSLAARAAEDAERARSRLLVNMGREIRAPMDAILASAAHLQQGSATDAERAEALRSIQQGGHALLGVIDDIIDLSKIESGTLQVDRVPTSLAHVVDEVVRTFAGRAEHKGVTCEARFCPRIPERFPSDPTRLRQILANLVESGLKATVQGGVEIAVDLDDADPDDTWLSVAVSDSGPEIASDALPRVFETFACDDDDAPPRLASAGLGLRVSRRLANLLGGTIEVSSRPDRGVTFTLRLPAGSLTHLRLVGPAAALAAEPDAIASPEEVAPLSLRILLAEDNLASQRLLARMLEGAGVRVEMATTGREAVDTVRRCEAERRGFDCILMDLSLPDLDGLAATRELRAQGVRTPVIALAGDDLPATLERCRAAGCDECAAKPVDRKPLLDTIRRLTDDALAATASRPI